jgi:hypothetical protein
MIPVGLAIDHHGSDTLFLLAGGTIWVSLGVYSLPNLRVQFDRLAGMAVSGTRNRFTLDELVALQPSAAAGIDRVYRWERIKIRVCGALNSGPGRAALSDAAAPAAAGEGTGEDGEAEAGRFGNGDGRRGADRFEHNG